MDRVPEAENVRQIVELMGGQTMTAKFFGIRQSAVSQWVAAGRLPQARRRHLMDIHPEWFGAAGQVAQEGA